MATRSSTPRARIAAAGLDPERAVATLREGGLWSDEGPTDPELIPIVAEGADPDAALDVVATIAREHPDLWTRIRADDGWLRRLVAVGGTSRPLGDLLARVPDAAEGLERVWPIDPGEIAERVAQAVAAADSQTAQAEAVARIRRRATADVAARDLTGEADVASVAAELAALAEGVLTGTLAALHPQVADGEPSARIGVIGMGKLGGFELNYVSDVDVVFVHAPLDDADPEVAKREARQVCERLLAVLNASTTMGRAYEVDPTLRPEGRSGALSRTVDAFVSYWERWAETWEFQALIKARPVAGDRTLGAELLRRSESFVYPEHLDPGVVAEIRRMKGRVEAKPEVQRHGARQVKLGPGGLRDIEFAVQLLQLVHGRADRALRVTGTLPALEALSRGGYVADEDAEELAGAYRLLRTVEHHLQLAHERRTHTIPDDEGRQEWLARSLGYRPTSSRTARDGFVAELLAAQAQVRELHAKLFYRPLLEAHASVPASSGTVSLPDEVRHIGEDAALERLGALGFRDARAALRDVRALTSGVSRRARILRAVLPAMLHALQESPDPDTGLKMLRRLVESGSAASELLPHLRDHPPAADLLARVLGTSEVAGELLVATPQGVEWLLDDVGGTEPRTRDELVQLAMGRLAWQDRSAALRRFKRHELLRIVLRDLAGHASVSSVGRELTALGEACLEAALQGVLDEVVAEDGLEELPLRMALIGMGKLGGEELHYCSDLDVVFVHEPGEGVADDAASRFANAVAERVMRSLSAITAEGTAFEVDADLRPEGRSGPLSRSLVSMRRYYGEWAEPWEHQALLRARPVAGDPDLGAAFVELARSHAYPDDPAAAGETAMRRMKARLEKERIPRRIDPGRHIKLGPGGLSDVEWTVQLLQRRHGGSVAGLRTPGTMAALDALQDDGLVDHRDATWLREGYHALSRVRNGLYLLRQRDVDALPTRPDVVERLARALGYGRAGRQELEADLKRHMRHVRQVTDRVFYGLEPSLDRRQPTWGRD
jgi:glutamate-ammonia-ligase adenylyltransferase